MAPLREVAGPEGIIRASGKFERTNESLKETLTKLTMELSLDWMKEEGFRHLFTAISMLTDYSLNFTKDGKFRKFGFIGFKFKEEAQLALNHFNKSFIDMSRITRFLLFCVWNSASPSGIQESPEPGANMPRDQGSPSSPHKAPFPQKLRRMTRRKRLHVKTEQLKEDTKFQEFLSVHQKRTQVATWANDALDTESSEGKSKPTSDYLNFDSDSGQESEKEAAEEESGEQGLEAKAAAQWGLLDMEYLNPRWWLRSPLPQRRRKARTKL
ncbi:putative RNA-binding protein 19 [Callospermophilus lateralis]|uniref:putative RNA-binding protein 19 n=1 Tax=Callospermophilus lateralis TaxID=76772 RepID=UPI0040545380